MLLTPDDAAGGPPPDGAARGPLRIVVADDAVLLREGLVRLLAEDGHQVVAAVGDGPALVEAVLRHRPDVSVVDVRMPPTHTDEGLRAAITARSQLPGAPMLVLSQYVEASYAADLLADGSGAVGYLLKDRVARVEEFLDALDRVARGATVLDPQVVAQLLAGQRRDRPAGRADRAGTGAPGADGRGPFQHGHRPAAGAVGQRGGKAHRQHLRQARPAARRRPAPPGARRPRLPQGLTRPLAGRARRPAPPAGRACHTRRCPAHSGDPAAPLRNSGRHDNTSTPDSACGASGRRFR